MNKKVLEEQLLHYRKLKMMPPSRLKATYNREFKGTPFFITLTKDVDIRWVAKKLFFLYCYKRPHLTKGTKEYNAYIEHLEQKLAEPIKFDTRERKLRIKAGHAVVFTKPNIMQMPELEIDGYLILMGLRVKGTLAQKRQVLWEAYQNPTTDLPKIVTDDGESKHIIRKTKFANRFVLRDVILAHPDMGWPEFEKSRYRDLMPNVTRASFHNARSKIRAEVGEEHMPRLPYSRKSNKPLNLRKWVGKVVPKVPDKIPDPLIEPEFLDD